MRRREFLLTGAAASLPLDVGAQAMRRRIGFLTSASDPGLIETSYLSGFPRGMRDLGYVEGKHFTIEWRFAEGRLERFRDFAAELVDLKVDVIVAGTPDRCSAFTGCDEHNSDCDGLFDRSSRQRLHQQSSPAWRQCYGAGEFAR